MTAEEATLPAFGPRSILGARALSIVAMDLLALVGSARHAVADEPLSPTQAIAELRLLTEVAGDHVGYEAVEGRFFALSKRFLTIGDEGSRRALLGEPNPVARAMGLFLLMRTKGVEAVPILTASLGDRARFDHYPAGCVGGAISVGAFARELLHNRHHLRYGVPAEPLVNAAGLRRIDFGILADDRAANLHDRVGVAIRKEFEAGRVRLEWATLRREGGGLTDMAIVKAVGRLRANGTEDFLLATLADASADPLARLAAASALTASPSVDVANAIERARADLDRAWCGPITDQFLDTLKASESHERRWNDIDESPGAVQKAGDQALLRAVTEDHPLAIWSLTDALRMRLVAGDTRGALVDSLVRIASGLRLAAPWDAYGDAPFRLEVLAVPVWSYPRRGEIEYEGLKSPERARLAQALRPHLPSD